MSVTWLQLLSKKVTARLTHCEKNLILKLFDVFCRIFAWIFDGITVLGGQHNYFFWKITVSWRAIYLFPTLLSKYRSIVIKFSHLWKLIQNMYHHFLMSPFISHPLLHLSGMHLLLLVGIHRMFLSFLVLICKLNYDSIS